jgi:CheY-like chemotaxis protein
MSVPRVLLMDDEPLILKVTGQMIERLGYAVDLTETGEEAVAKFKNGLQNNAGYALLILDLHIVSGYGAEEVMRQVRPLDPNVKAVISTGFAMDRNVTDYEEHGFVGVLSKPYKLEELQALLKEHIG